MIEAFPEDSAPRFLLRDRDSIYGQDFQRRVAGMQIEEVITAPHSTWQNPYAERLIGSIRRESFRLITISVRIDRFQNPTLKMVRKCMDYNLALGGNLPDSGSRCSIQLDINFVR